jgi:hypothetical protein
MNRVAGLLFLGGVILLASWVWAPAAPVSLAPPAASAAGLEQSAGVVAEVNAEVDRLRERLAAPPQFPPPARDPFRFGERPEPARRATPPVLAEPLAPVEPPAPRLPLLVAIAANIADGVVTRTAVLADGDDVRLVKEGDQIGRFVVRSVGADAAELVDPTTSRTYRIVLK